MAELLGCIPFKDRVVGCVYSGFDDDTTTIAASEI
jgi:hypothetical protein